MATKKSKFVPKFKSLRALFKAKSRWTKEMYARTVIGTECFPHSHKAVSFCLVGGLEYCYPEREIYKKARNRIREVLGKKFYSTENYNDDPKRTIEDIRALVRKARV